MPKMSKMPKLDKLLNNKNVLYAVFVIAILNLLGYLMMQNTEAVVFFLIVGFLTTYFSKNMTVVLIVAMVATSIFALVSNAFNISSTLITSICKSMFCAPLGKGPIPIPISFFLSIILDAMSIALKPSLNLLPTKISCLVIGCNGVDGLNKFLNIPDIDCIDVINPFAIVFIFF